MWGWHVGNASHQLKANRCDVARIITALQVPDGANFEIASDGGDLLWQNFTAHHAVLK